MVIVRIGKTQRWGLLDWKKNVSNEPVLREFALSILPLPLINAAVERTFSQMNIIKSRTRNKMKQPMLEAILYFRGYMTRNKCCCNEFHRSQSMFARFNASAYDNMDQNVLPETFWRIAECIRYIACKYYNHLYICDWTLMLHVYLRAPFLRSVGHLSFFCKNALNVLNI